MEGFLCGEGGGAGEEKMLQSTQKSELRGTVVVSGRSWQTMRVEGVVEGGSG